MLGGNINLWLGLCCQTKGEVTANPVRGQGHKVCYYLLTEAWCKCVEHFYLYTEASHKPGPHKDAHKCSQI